MKLVWKYFVPIMFMILGISVLYSNPDEPYSATAPIVLGIYQRPIGIFLILCAIFIGFSIYRFEKNSGKRKPREHGSENKFPDR